jgi:hypothetical protein
LIQPAQATPCSPEQLSAYRANLHQKRHVLLTGKLQLAPLLLLLLPLEQVAGARPVLLGLRAHVAVPGYQESVQGKRHRFYSQQQQQEQLLPAPLLLQPLMWKLLLLLQLALIQ